MPRITPLAVGAFAVAFGAATAAAAASSVVLDIPGRHQWPDRDGYCGSNSIQMNALYLGAWLSQDVVRSAVTVGNCDASGVGNEILHVNIECALKTLKINVEAWDYHNEPRPQAKSYLIWLKKHLAQKHPAIWFIYCKGDSHRAHGDEQGYGHYDHIEPVIGVQSNHSLVDERDLSTYYGDDVLVHHSDWSKTAYYRAFDSIPDTPAMDGNCKNVLPVGGGPNEAYPCIPEQVDYGYAMTGMHDPNGVLLPAHLSVDSWTEPDTVEGKPPQPFHGTLTVEGLKEGQKYTIFRYDGFQTVPDDGLFAKGKYSSRFDFEARNGSVFVHQDRRPILSNTSVYYFVLQES